MKKSIFKINNISEKFVINKYFSKLNFNKPESFKYQNDAAYLKTKLNHEIIATNDSIVENFDFFKNDDPRSIAHKIVTTNLSDLSSMGAQPYCYMLNLCLNYSIDLSWLNEFSKHLFKLQKKYNFFLIGGDLSKSSSLMISGTFYGYAKSNNIIPQKKVRNNDNIWVTGNLGESYIGYKINKYKKINLNNNDKKYFLNKYFFPKPSMLGFHIAKYCSSAIDISDGFFGDLNKMLNGNFGAKIQVKSLPISNKLKKIVKNNLVNFEETINWGDDYQLIFTSQSKFEKKIKLIAKKEKIKITKIGHIINKKGIYSDSSKLINSYKYYDHFA
tara:strand:+ start:7664 stop:8650 length:987 start_codon:yes stop_codon:yes gene_type:complete